MRLSTAGLILGCLIAVPTAHADAPAGAVPVETRADQRRPAAAADLSRYAERERQAKDLEEFEGGRGGGAIATSTLIVILLVVIIIVLVI